MKQPISRVFVFLLTLALVCSMAAVNVAAESGSGKHSFSLYVGLQETTINTSNNDIYAWRVAQENTGINVEYVYANGDNLVLMIASNDLPDAIIQTWTSFSGGPQGAIDNGVIIPLSESLLAEQAPNYWAYIQKYEDIRKMVTTDDSVHYQIAGIMTWEPDETKGFTSVIDRDPFYESWMGPIIRKDILDAAGLPLPETVDDWTAALRLMKEQGFASPMSAPVGNFQTSNAFAGAFGITLGLYQDESGKVHYGPLEPGYADYITLLNGWYEEGLLDADYAAIDGTAARTKVINGEAGATIGTGSVIGVSYAGAHELDPDTSFYSIAVKHPKLNAESGEPVLGQKAYPYLNGVGITPKCVDPSAVLNFFDYLWSDEGTLVANWGGIEGVTYDLTANGLPEFSASLADNEWGYPISTMTQKVEILNGPFPVDLRNRLYQMTLYDTPEPIYCRGTWSNALYSASLPPYSIPTDKSSDFASLSNDITTFFNENHIKFIMGLEPLENIEAFQNSLHRIGVDDYIAIAQDALDQYNAR
ncbi:ABC transporter substrate-binding protein [Clostridia bacterium]|nr:ABC transporter substrate-binding protein [Clostridia bacterium]